MILQCQALCNRMSLAQILLVAHGLVYRVYRIPPYYTHKLQEKKKENPYSPIHRASKQIKALMGTDLASGLTERFKHTIFKRITPLPPSKKTEWRKGEERRAVQSVVIENVAAR